MDFAQLCWKIERQKQILFEYDKQGKATTKQEKQKQGLKRMNRRDFLQRSGAAAGMGVLGLTGCAPRKPVTASATPGIPPLPVYDAVPQLVPIRAHEDRIFRITVCLRPFRAAGPRIEVEKVGDKVVVHNYGHGGSGWSLSWGSAMVAVEKALADGDKDVAVIGCGALGLTSAITLQRAGARVTIYAKERPPDVRSARATGSWTPDSRVATNKGAAPGFGDLWERMARRSFSMYQSYLGMPGAPIEWVDRYALSGLDNAPQQQPGPEHAPMDFAQYADRIADITQGWQALPQGSHPFPAKQVRRSSSMTFNVADYSRQLMNDFYIAGGRIETAEFHTPNDVTKLPQRVIVNCTGYGARALWGDESVIPVRGQIAWLIPQAGVDYGLYFNQLNILGRRDGIVVQASPQGEASGWNDTNEQPDRAEAVAAVQQLAALMGGWRRS